MSTIGSNQIGDCPLTGAGFGDDILLDWRSFDEEPFPCNQILIIQEITLDSGRSFVTAVSPTPDGTPGNSWEDFNGRIGRTLGWIYVVDLKNFLTKNITQQERGR